MKRSECHCDCHEDSGASMHIMPCCEPDKKPEHKPRRTIKERIDLISSRDEKFDILYKYVDDLFKCGNFEECDKFLREIDINDWSTNLLIGVLTATLAGKHQLKERANLVERIEKILMELAPNRIEGLIGGLR